MGGDTVVDIFLATKDQQWLNRNTSEHHSHSDGGSVMLFYQQGHGTLVRRKGKIDGAKCRKIDEGNQFESSRELK